MTARYLLRRGWRGIWPPAQTLDTDQFRRRRTAAATPPRGRARTIVVIGATPMSGATTLTVLLAAVSYGLQGISPALLSAKASGSLKRRVPAHLPDPHERQPDVALADAVNTLKTTVHAPAVLVDATLETARTDPAFFTEADVVVVTCTPDTASALAARSLIAWLSGIRATAIIEVTMHTTQGRHTLRHSRAVPHDPALQESVVALDRLHPATLDAAVDLLALINTRSPGRNGRGATPSFDGHR